MKEVRRIARAKINLGLDVVGRRDNGYHDVRMIMQTVQLHDKIRLKRIRADKVIIETNLPFLPTDDRNLVVKVVKYFREKYKIADGVFIDLYKVIPVGAGLAGGSTDAAQTIYGMNELFDLNLSLDVMMDIGAKFGADIPYCLLGNTALAEGIGETLTTLKPIPKLHLVIARPRVAVATAFVYEKLDQSSNIIHPEIDGMIQAIDQGNVKGIIERLGNVLEDVTVKHYQEMLDTKKAILETGAQGALMTGSGSAVYGIYDTAKASAEAASRLKSNPLIRYVFDTTTYNSDI